MSAPRVLVMEGDLAEAQILEDAIFEIPEREEPSQEGPSRRFWWNARVLHADTLSAGLLAVRNSCADLVLLNPTLPDCQGIDTFRMLKVQGPDLPVILLLDPGSDETIGRIGLREGAQDYLFKSRCDWETLAHTMENSIERSRTMKTFWNSFFKDSLTGLPNRSGFIYLGDLLHTAMQRHGRRKASMMVATFMDNISEDGVRKVADAIRDSIETGDLAGRLGPHQFGILSNRLSLEELILRLTRKRLHVRLCWSEQSVANVAESMDRLIVSADSLPGDASPVVGYSRSIH